MGLSPEILLGITTVWRILISLPEKTGKGLVPCQKPQSA